MKTIKLTATQTNLGVGSYVSPEVAVSEIHSEGVLCVSSPDNEGWTEDKLDW